ncbi:conserved hypothetical protein [Ricinus communis]|uniref:Cell differentiation protein rcd1 n=2 Tax=Ricinus communis TaxID=3988 RepID=B9STL2_RICCO|nr:conserved hypothetical protein [Ricinus communis]
MLQTQKKVIREAMAPRLWYSFNIITVLLQWIAAHPDTRMPFVRANMPLYLQPILDVKSEERHHGDVRISSLRVIAALVKDDDPRAINFIIKSEMFSCFLKHMENSTIPSRTPDSGLIVA